MLTCVVCENMVPAKQPQFSAEIITASHIASHQSRSRSHQSALLRDLDLDLIVLCPSLRGSVKD